jgi:hypothetical protein
VSTLQQKDNAGSLFKNDRKETEKHPDYKGSATIDGVDYWLSAWINVSQKDNKTKYMSLAFTAKEERAPAKEPAPVQPVKRAKWRGPEVPPQPEPDADDIAW